MNTILMQHPREAAARTASDETPSRTRAFEFREVTEVGEVEALLRLRHRVYREAEDLRGYLDPDGPPVLLDAYDRFSRLFALFERSAECRRVVGTVRIVMQEPGPANLALEMVAAGHPGLAQVLRARRREAFPFLEVLPDRTAAMAAVTRAMLRGEVVTEAGRFAVDRKFRAGGPAGPGLARHMIESAMALMMLPGCGDRAFITSAESHLALYRRAGFHRVPGVPPGRAPGHGPELTCLQVDRQSLPASVRERVMNLAAEFAATGRTTLAVAADGTAHASSEARRLYPWPSARRIPLTSPIPHAGLRVAAIS